MPHPKTNFRPILRRGDVGFILIVALCWVVEVLQIPHLFFDESAEFNWARVLFRTAVILGVWIWVHFTTKRLLERLHRLEEFLLVCSWCRKLGYKGDWLLMEDFFGSKFDTKTSHGICPECSAEQFRNFDLDLAELESAFSSQPKNARPAAAQAERDKT